jgi:hypothetical protein
LICSALNPIGTRLLEANEQNVLRIAPPRIIKSSLDDNVLTNKTTWCQHVVLTTDAGAKHHQIDGGRLRLFSTWRGADDVAQVVNLRKR